MRDIEHFPKNVQRFSDKKSGQNKKLEQKTAAHFSGISLMGSSLFLTIFMILNGLFFVQTAAAQAQSASPETNVAEPAQEVTATIVQPGDFDSAYHAYFIGNQKTAFDLARSRADLGDAAAMSLLGLIYSEGRAVMRNPELAAYWFAEAAQAGDPQAALKHGLSLYNGFRVPVDKERGEEFVKRAVDAHVPASYGHYAHMIMARLPENEQLDVGLKWFLQGVAAGDADSAYYAAHILDSGTRTRPANLPAARALLELAASGGNSGAQMDLANWLLEGYGGERDPQTAFALIKTLAVRQIVPAQLRLARMYYEGVGTSEDIVMAAAWYIQASQYDLKTAGIDTSDLDVMLSGMSPAQVAQAQERAATLLYTP